MPSFNSKFSGGGGAVRATTITADDLEIDSGTLSIDETNNRVGMGTTAPGTQLQIESNTPYVTLKNDTSENTDGGCEAKLIFEDHANTSLGQIEVSHSGSSDDTKGKMILSTHTGSSLTAAITINEAQKVTAAGDVQVTGDIILDDGGSLKEAGGTAAITFDGSGHVTKIGQDSPSSGQFLKYDGAKWVADAVATGSSAADDISTGDAAVTIATSSGNITLDAQAGDADIIFKGTDDTSDITALTLDMSEAGAALFNAAVTVGTDLTVTGGDITYGATNSTLAVGATAHDAAGATLNISGGAPTAGTSNNQAGGSVTISGGQGKGSGAGGDIVFKTANAGSSGSSLNSLATALTISDDLSSTFAGVVNTGVVNSTVTAATGVTIDQNFSVTDASTTIGLDIDFDKTGNSTSDNTMIGINLDMDNTSATGGNNEMVGIKVTPTLTHASGTGTATCKGLEIGATGATATPQQETVRAIDIVATGAETNQGIFMKVDNGTGPDIKMISSANSGDSATITTGANGEFTIATTDADAALAHINLVPDGDVIIKNTVNDSTAAVLRFVKDKGAAGADADGCGEIEFFGDDDNQDNILFAKVRAEVADASNGAEGGRLMLGVATHDGEFQNGLVIEDGSAEDEVNVIIGNVTTSKTSVSGALGVRDTAPKVSLNVVHDYNLVTFENQLADGEGGGRVLRYSPGADDTLTVGQLYFLHTDGTWDQTDADAVATGATQMLGIGLGNARTAGCLMEGFIRIPSTEILNVPGSGAVDGLPIYVSTTAGHLDFTAPSGGGDFVRIVGHALDDDGGDVLIYFNPSNNHVEL